VQSGARINISDASCPERIVTVSGTTQQIVDAFSMISHRFEEVTSLLSVYLSFCVFCLINAGLKVYNLQRNCRLSIISKVQ